MQQRLSAHTEQKHIKRMFNVNSYFEGYEEYYVPKKNGKGFTAHRIYTANYFVHEMSDAERKKQKSIFLTLTIAAMLLFVIAALQRTGANTVNFMAMPVGFSGACLIFSLWYCGTYALLPRQMTRFDCNNTHKKLMMWTILAGICLIGTAIAAVVFECLHEFPEFGTVALCIVLDLIASIACFTVARMEHRTSYTEEANNTVVPNYREELSKEENTPAEQEPAEE